MPPSPSQQPSDAGAAEPLQKDIRSPQRAALIAVLLAAETAVCSQAGAVTASAVAAPNAAGADAPPVRRVGALDALDEETRRKVCSYLSWRDCLKLKPLSKRWNAATEEVVTLETLPDAPTPTAAVFLTCPAGVVEDTQLELQLRCQHPSKWRCVACGFCNSETRILCGNRACQIPCPTHADCARLFVGQLRREGTVPMLKWLVEGVFGSYRSPVSIVNVENHRQLTTSRGKGCAWVYLQHRAMADTVLQFNHRVFTDVHPTTGREGVWIVARGDESALQESVKVRGYVRGRDLVLPRNAIVVEFPSRQPSLTSSTTVWEGAAAAPSAQTNQGTMPPSYAAAAAASSVGLSTTPEANWYPATDSPPSESSTEMPNSSSPTPTMRSRRNQPYGSASWTPTTAVSPALAGEFPPSMSSGYYDGAEYEACAYYSAPAYGNYAQQAVAAYGQQPYHHNRSYRRSHHHHSNYHNTRGYYYGQAVPVYQGVSF